MKAVTGPIWEQIRHTVWPQCLYEEEKEPSSVH